MAIYQNYAHLIGVDQNHTINPALAKPCGIIATGYIGGNDVNGKTQNVIDPKFTQHVQDAYDLGVPAFMLFRMYMPSFQGWINEPAPMDEWNMQVLQTLVGNPKRKIAGIVIDARAVSFTNTGDNHATVLTPTNWAKAVQWFYNAAWKQFGIGLYVLMDQKTVDLMGVDSAGAISNAITKMNGHCCVSIAAGSTVGAGDWANVFYPPDDWKPKYLGNVSRVWFSFYNYNTYTFPGVTGIPDLWQYSGTVEKMYSEIGFTGTAPVIVPVDPGTTPIPTPTTGLTDSQKLDYIIAKLDKHLV